MTTRKVGIRGYKVTVMGESIVYASTPEDGLLKIAKFMRECAETPFDQHDVIECPFARGGIQITEML